MAESKSTFNIFVSGGSQSAGLAAVKALLAKGHQVAAATNDAAGALAIRQAGALPVYPDLTRQSEILSSLKMTNAEILVHAAPQIFGGAPQSAPDGADCLVKTSRAILGACQAQGLRQIIVISFAYLYESREDPAAEAAPNVHDHDSQPMLAAEALWQNSGLPVHIIRAGCIYGGDSPATRALAQAIKQSRPLPKGEQTASWIHEDDLAAAIVALIEAARTAPQIINAAADRPHSPNDFAISLSHALGLSSPSFAASSLIASLFRGETRQDRLLRRQIVIDSSKIKAEYGWQPRYPNLEQGLEATTLAWRMQEAINPDDFYNAYEDKAAAAIAAIRYDQPLPAPPAEEEQPAASIAEKPAPVKASAPPPSDGPAPWNEDEAKREERRRKALERKAKRAAKRAAGA